MTQSFDDFYEENKDVFDPCVWRSAENAWNEGAKSKQAEIDELRKQVTGQARTAQNQQATIYELQKRIEKTDSLIMSFGDSIDVPLRNSLIDAIRGLEDL